MGGLAGVVACDVSEWQNPASNSYPHRWLIFRACDGSYVDKVARRNLAWAVSARNAGRIDGFTVYVVYRPGQNATILRVLADLAVPTDCVLMIDVESWGGVIRGNRSAEINQLAYSLAHRQGSRDLVWGYANRGDYANLWPQRPAWLGLIVASYGGSKPDNPGPGPMVGWQYTNGQWDVPGLPASSRPFGACDHNLLYRLPIPPKPAPAATSSGKPLFPSTTEDDDMPLYLVEVDPTDCAKHKVAWPGWCITDGFRLRHVEGASGKGDNLRAWQSVGVKAANRTITLAEYKAMGGE